MESISLKIVILKVKGDWKVSEEVSIFGICNGYNLINFTNALHRSKVFKGQA